MKDSILHDCKKMLGIEDDYKAFDSELFLHINSIFVILNQLGVGPPSGFLVEDEDAKWEHFLGDSRRDLNLVKSYVFIRLRLMFDPPANSFLVNSLTEQAKEFEWRLNVQVETPQFGVDYR